MLKLSRFFYSIINSRLGKSFFCGAANCPPRGGILMRRRVADFGFFLIWRPGFGAPRQRRRGHAPVRIVRARRPSRTIERSDPRLAGPMLRCGKQGIKTAANQLAHAGTPAREFSRRRDELGAFLRPPIAQRRSVQKLRLYAIVHKR
jgi:hypothetical protein